jgi:hypothetical protein
VVVEAGYQVNEPDERGQHGHHPGIAEPQPRCMVPVFGG